jgi:hypothetical protein
MAATPDRSALITPRRRRAPDDGDPGICRNWPDRNRNDDPSMLFPVVDQRQRWPINAIATASMAH